MGDIMWLNAPTLARLALAPLSAVVVLTGQATTARQPQTEPTAVAAPRATSYDRGVLSDAPVGYWPGRTDLTGHGHDGTFSGAPRTAAMPNGDSAPRYDGVRQYLTIADAPDLSVTRSGRLTIEAWLRPDTLQFPHGEGSGGGYVHWLGKGVAGQHEYVARMYSLDNPDGRPNRISGYALNTTGGLGAGSYFQDIVRRGEWIHYALVINIVDTSDAYPTGYVKVFKNGRLRDQDSLSEYHIVPRDGIAPFRIATRNLTSYFQGAIGKVAVYDREVTASRLLAHYRNMVTPSAASQRTS
jgi:hypothetical protein